ncbi:DUF3048 domain-containing protein [Streptomyces sp. NPDC001939]|uniref:DUF3048 domain-containing protein n=1 Tax=Streptomyces TaxID=1883 RepID=UPI001D0B4454|nr:MULTISPECIES: DUF3048 domain-containing protein [Streptomyces]MCX5085595.1 DUF3048 domain-containing protein [Streptomyces sp. NBC_00401]UDM05269.1 DUF3048 domain-containing protein [Streptomyces longhuiensis]
MRVTRGRRTVIVAAVLAATAAGCTVGDRHPPDGHSASPTAEGARGPVLAVKIDNVGPARPQTGIGRADIVYAEQVESGLSRLMAVYATRLPPVVGPVRSARETDIELLRQFDRPALAFSGAQSKLLPLIAEAPLTALPPGEAPAAAYFRGGDRPAPHNLYLRPAKLGVTPKAGALASAGVTFGAPPAGGQAKNTLTVRFPAARFTFTWSTQSGSWQVSMDGTRARTTDGGPLNASTVVVQYVDVRGSRFHDRSGNTSPFSDTVGTGKATVLRDGRAYDVRWERRSAADGTQFTTAAGGKRMTFAPGQVWVLFAER